MENNFDIWTNSFSENIFKQKYSLNKQEKWSDTCKRVTESVCGQLLSADDKDQIYKYMLERKFIPGGRYLYAAGRPFHQVNNCMIGTTRIITKNGIYSLIDLVNQDIEVLNRFGQWEYATVKEFGRQELFKVIFEDGRSVISTMNHRWWQLDGTRVTTNNLKTVPYAQPHSEDIDEEGIRHGIIFGDGQLDTKTKNYSYIIISNPNKTELSNFFPDNDVVKTVGGNAKVVYKTIRRVKAGLKIGLQPAHYKSLPNDKMTPAYARGFTAGLIATDGSTKTHNVTISCEGYDKALQIAEIATLGGCVVTSVKVNSKVNPYNGSERELTIISIIRDTAPLIRSDQIADINSKTVKRRKFSLDVTSIEPYCSAKVYCVVAPQTESFTLATGLLTSNCFLFRAEDSREGWSDLMQKITASLMTGGGIGIDYSLLRPRGAKIHKTGGESTGPIALMHMVNEAGRYIMQGGSRRSAIWSGLSWQHGDIKEFINIKNWSEDIKKIKERDFTFPAPMEGTNISVIYDTEFFIAIENKSHPLNKLAKEIWTLNCLQAFKTAEPGMSFNFLKDNESLRNACTEVTSEDDSDKCNLGTVWMNRFDNREDFANCVKFATKFLMCGGIYSDVPTSKIKAIGLQNNRIGLGLGGMHEWLMKRNEPYYVTHEMHKWLNVYEHESDAAAFITSRELGVSKPKGVRAIAPTGTIGILAETTTGIEPLFCKAYKRRYLKGEVWHYEYVVDASVKRMKDAGIDINSIQDAYDLTFKDRVKFQADVQNYVDMSISSTCNLPHWGSESNNEESLEKNSKVLLKYAKRLRGFTCYPDGSRGGQPLTRVELEEALGNEGVVFEEREHECIGGVCGV